MNERENLPEACGLPSETADPVHTDPIFAEPKRPGRAAVASLFAAGVILVGLVVHRGGQGALQIEVQVGLVMLAALAAFVPTWNRLLFRLVERVRRPSPAARAVTTSLIWAFAFAYLLLTARSQHRDMFPRLHDECSYTIQARMLSQGRLWQPQHELSDFFETFHFLCKPVYASIYFPGAALMNVPGIWMRLPSWFMPVVLAALVVALSYRVVAEMIDGAAGLLSAMLLLATAMFRVHSTMVMSQVPVMLLGLLMVWAWLRWRGGKKLAWALLVGVLGGWAAITRPADAVAFAIPVCLAIAWELRRVAPLQIAQTAAALVAGALPFLCLQVVFDLGVTGKAFHTPYVYYLEQNQPGSVFGSRPVSTGVPASDLPQKEIYLSQLTKSEKSYRDLGIGAWAAARLQLASTATLPCASLLALLPVGFVASRRRGCWVVAGSIPLFLLLYAFNPFFLLHYSIPLAAAVGLCVVLGARAVEESFGAESSRRTAGTFVTTAIALLAAASLPQFNRHVHDEPYQTPSLDRTEQVLAEIPAPAVVLFHFSPKCNVHEEPVYNLDVTWPDDAPIIRAQDLGPRNADLLRYYAVRQPARTYYLFDRFSGAVFPLGNVAEAAATLHVDLRVPASATADVR